MDCLVVIKIRLNLCQVNNDEDAHKNYHRQPIHSVFKLFNQRPKEVFSSVI